MGQEYLLQASDSTAIMAPSASVVTVPRRWLNFMRRCLNFKPGRYIVVITVEPEACDWSVQEVGKVEQ